MNHLETDLHQGVAHLRLLRLETLNALSRDFCAAIDAELARLDGDPQVRVLLISSGAKHFCVGADIRDMASMDLDTAVRERFIGCVGALKSMRKPVVAAVHGIAAGGGCELVEMCDIVVAAASARFCHPEITLAAMPGAGGTQRLARAVGKHLAMDLLLTGRTLSAQEALAAGLVSRVVADETLLDEAQSIATRVASWSAPVAARIKACVNQAQVGLADGLDTERQAFQQCFLERDFAEGLAAFMEKRPANFEHR